MLGFTVNSHEQVSSLGGFTLGVEIFKCLLYLIVK